MQLRGGCANIERVAIGCVRAECVKRCGQVIEGGGGVVADCPKGPPIEGGVVSRDVLFLVLVH